MSQTPPGAPETAPEESEVTYCYGHPDTPTRLHCTRCDKPICPRCSVPASVGQHCVWCVAEAKKTAPKVKSAMQAAAPVITGLIVVNVAIWIAQSILLLSQSGLRFGFGNADWLSQHFGSFAPAIADGEYYRLFTSMFLHLPFSGTLFSLMHIGFNMYVLRIYGPEVERRFGGVRFLAMYLISGLGGSAASYAFGNCGSLGVGASGAIFGVIGMLLVLLYNRRDRAFVNHYMRSLLLFIGINLLIGFTFPGIDNLAHIGGLVTGLALGYGMDLGHDGEVRAGRQVLSYVLPAAVVVALVVWRTAQITSGGC
ncbi:MAG: rhomboid family intramembrane serine protease [Actinomycetota bacterium]